VILPRVLFVLGVVLVLGGVSHSIGVGLFYATAGVPDANRVLLDIWIAEAQLLGGGLYLAAFRKWRAGTSWRTLSAFGAFTIVGFALPILPVLFLRAPWMFRIPQIIYLAFSLFIAAVSLRSEPSAPPQAADTA
jgi:hypothetical protein